MNGHEFVNRLDFDYERIRDLEVDDIPLCDLYSFVFER